LRARHAKKRAKRQAIEKLDVPASNRELLLWNSRVGLLISSRQSGVSPQVAEMASLIVPAVVIGRLGAGSESGAITQGLARRRAFWHERRRAPLPGGQL